MDNKHVKLEVHPEGTLIKRVTGETIGGITHNGTVLVHRDIELSDDELLEIMMIPHQNSAE